MKTPREILTQKHKAIAPKLDAIRRETVVQFNQGAKEQNERINLVSWCLGGLKVLWHELFLPSRRIWASLAAVWIAIIAANFSMRDHAPATMAKQVSPEMVQTFKQQEQLLTELIGPFDSSAAEPQKTYSPRPSSLRPLDIITA